MKIIRTSFYFFVVTNIVHSNFYQKVSIDQSIQRILQSVVHQDVIIRIQEYDTYDRAERLLDVVTQTVITTWPSQIFVTGRTRSNFPTGNMASSRTMLIYIYASDNNISYTELNVTVEDVRSISYPKHLPRLLLIIGSNERTLNAQRQLKYLWDLGFFDVIILQVSFRSKFSDPVFVVVHCFNGFNEDYSRLTVYEDDIDWYPNKLQDMYGNAFKIKFEETRLYGIFEPRNGRVGGIAKLFADAFSHAANATIVNTRFLQESDLIYNAKDLVYTDSYSMSYEHTVAVGDDRICLLVPILPIDEILIDFWRIIATILIGFLLAMIMWCTSLVLKVSERVRDPLNSISLLFGIAPLNKPHSLVEKVLFVAMIMTAAEYTAIFQAELFEFVIEFANDKRVSTFQDLFDTSLKIMVSPIVYNELASIEELSPEFMKRFTSVQKFKNKLDISMAYFRSEIDGKLAEIKTVNPKGERLFRLSDLCILSHYLAHTLRIRSPFKNKVNDVLLSLEEYGFVKKHIDDLWMNEGARNTESENEFILSDHSLYVAFLVILTGYLISFVVFVGELIADRIVKRKHSVRTKHPQIIAS